MSTRSHDGRGHSGGVARALERPLRVGALRVGTRVRVCNALVLIGAATRRREAVPGVLVARVASTRERARRVVARGHRVAVVGVVCSWGQSGRLVVCHLIVVH